MTYRNAFNCKRCPQSNDDRGCPVWWETVWEAPSGETRTIRSCGFTQIPLYLTEVIKASNRPAAAVEGVRNETAEGFERIVAGLQEFTSHILTRPRNTPGNGEIGHGDR